MPEDLKIDVAGAEAAMAAAGIDPMKDTATGPIDPFARPEAQTQAPAPVVEQTQEQAAPGQAESTPEVEPFTHIDDATILAGGYTPEQLLAFKKSLQADYTTKTQEAAPFRKLATERGMTAEDIANAAELYSRLQDPANLPQFQAELSQYMQANGLSPAQAQQTSAAITADLVPAPDYEEGDYQDPQMAQVLNVLKQQQEQIARLTDQTTQSAAQIEQERLWNATAQRLTQEETVIRAQNTSYTDDDIADIYSLMGPEGNLLQAQARFEQLVGGRLARYLGKKDAAHATIPTPAAGGGVIATPERTTPLTPDEAHRMALAHVAQLDAQDA